MKVSKKWLQICNIACAVLLLALLICQLLPFWTMPGCTCSGSCEPAPNKFTDPKVDPTCKACTITYKWCQNLEAKYQAGTDPDKLKDTTKDWTVSIQQYVWLPTFECSKGVTEFFQAEYNNPETDYKFMVNDIKGMPVLVFFFALLGAYFGIASSKNPLSSIFALCTSIGAVKGYLTMPIFQAGMLWQVHLVIAILIGLIALIPTYEYLRRAVVWLDPRQN